MPSAKRSKTEVLAESEGTLEWVEEEKDDGDQLQQWKLQFVPLTLLYDVSLLPRNCDWQPF